MEHTTKHERCGTFTLPTEQTDTKPTFTPGEWNIEESRAGANICDASGETIAGLWQRRNRDEEEPNAHLISASPDMYLAALKLITDLDNGYDSESNRAALRKALAKAEGKI